MQIKIGVVSRSLEFIDLVHTHSSNNVQIISKQVNYHHAAEAARDMAPSVDIIIARGRTATLIKKSLSIPVISCDYEPIDILTTLSKVPVDSYPIALIREESRVGRSLATLGLVERLWGHKLELIIYTDYKSLDLQLQNAVVKGIRGVIGGTLEIEMAAQYGLSKTELVMSRETVKETVEKAVLIVRTLDYERKTSSYISSILNATENNCILVNKLNKIIYINLQAERITGLKINDTISKVFPDISSPEQITQLKKGMSLKALTYNFPGSGSNIKVRFDLIPLFDHRNIYNGYLMKINTVEDVKATHEYNKSTAKDKHLNAKYSLKDIIGNSATLIYSKNLAREFAKSNLNILIYGETGTGKELFAHSIHKLSERSEYPFVAVNCATLPPNLLESELFGYEDGAFTGARKGGKKGLFELADGGTIFLDEIGEAPLEIQARLLRVLESHEIMRLGGNSQIQIDVRVLAATNKDLEIEVRNGTFRSDLFYRLSTLILHIPALRTRREDIPLLVEYFLSELKLTAMMQNNIKYYIDNLLVSLSDYSWPGNIRELRNIVERCTVEYNLLQSGFVKPTNVIQLNQTKSENTRPDKVEISGNIKAAEIELINSVGNKVNWNRKKMAEILGISLSTLWRKMRKNNINK